MGRGPQPQKQQQQQPQQQQLEAPPSRRGEQPLPRLLPGRWWHSDAVLVLGRCSCVLLVLESTLDDLGLASGALNPLDVLVILRLQ